MFLWLVSNIKVSVTASYVMGKCQTDVFVSVFCDVRDSMELPCDEHCLRDNAEWLYFLEKRHFTLVEEPKVFKKHVWNIHSASPTTCIFIVVKISHIQIYRMFVS